MICLNSAFKNQQNWPLDHDKSNSEKGIRFKIEYTYTQLVEMRKSEEMAIRSTVINNFYRHKRRVT